MVTIYHCSKRRELAQHAHSHGSQTFTHTLTSTQTSTQLQPRGAKRQLSYYFSVHAGSFRVSVIQRTLTWTTGSLSCVHLYTRGGWAHTPTSSQHNILDYEKLKRFSCAPDEIPTSVLWIFESDALPIEPPRHPRKNKKGVTETE